MLLRAIQGGHQDIIEWAVSHGAHLSEKVLVDFASLIPKPGSLKYLAHQFPECFDFNIESFRRSVEWHPRIKLETVEFLHFRGFVFTNDSIPAIVFSSCRGQISEMEANERFDIVFLHYLGLRWDCSRVDNLLVWATCEKLSWIVSRSENLKMERMLSL